MEQQQQQEEHTLVRRGQVNHKHTVPTKSIRPLYTLVALSFSLRRCEVYCVVCALVLLAGLQTKLTRRKLEKLHANMAAELTS